MISRRAIGLLLATSVLTVPAMAEPVTAPSGLTWGLQETLFEPTGASDDDIEVIRLRYVSELVADRAAYGFDVIEKDFVFFCESVGLQKVTESAPQARQIIVSVASDWVAFGETAPEIVQYFEAFRPEGNLCIWDGL